jgi:hypothetical protein
MGQLDTSRYDPVAGPERASAAHFTTDFESLEVFNGRGEFCGIFVDWVSFIARGHHLTGVGNSDTHGLSNPAGYPRNYLPSAATRPDEITHEEILSALEDGRVSVSGGALITFPGGPELGSLMDVSAGATFDLPVRVQTPTWSTIDRLVVVVDGQLVRSIPIDEPVGDVIVLDETLELEVPERDTYLMVVAWGTTPMPIVTPGQRPFGFTNPVYLDVDGDGDWTPPGIASADDLPNLPIPWCR